VNIFFPPKPPPPKSETIRVNQWLKKGGLWGIASTPQATSITIKNNSFDLIVLIIIIV
jgi:hypothetical protein